jgi:hypothetical protein
MDILYDHRSSLDNTDMEYDDVMAELNASLKRSASVQSSTLTTGSNERRANVTGFFDVDVADYDVADQLPSVEEARMNAKIASTRIKSTSNSSKTSIVYTGVDDDDDDYKDPYKKIIHSPEQEKMIGIDLPFSF